MVLKNSEVHYFAIIYLGLDPNQLTDKYATYWDLNSNHTKINYLYAIANPKSYKGYELIIGV
jgi:hypothetical protein